MTQNNHNKSGIKCWELLQCQEKECRVFGDRDKRCWLQEGTHCQTKIQGNWLEKMELCLDCLVFEENLGVSDIQDTLRLIAEQFKRYRSRIEEKESALIDHQYKLEEFKKTSIYLLRELDKKTGELQAERNLLGIRVREKTDELKKTHEKLMQSTKLAALGRFSAGIAHEINNPLGAIINYTRNLLANPSISGQNRGYLELILKGLFRIEYIVRQILSYSGGQNATLQRVEINSIVHESLSLLQHRLDQKQIKLKLNMKEELPPVYVDPFQIQQVLSNIIRNAIDASKAGDTLIVISASQNGHIALTVTDKGSGMSREVLEKIFDPFYTTKEVGEGTGLGLFLSYNIIQMYHGEIEVLSEEGKGTQVNIRLPISD